MAKHELHPTPTTVHWGHFDAALKPVLEIEPGDELVITSMSGSPEQIPQADSPYTVRSGQHDILAVVKPELGPHLLTGPVAIRGAEPGDALRIEILDVTLADDWGYNVIRPERGALPDDFPYSKLIHFGVDATKSKVSTPWGMVLDAKPFFGIMGVAPAPSEGRISSVAPGSFGGNLDNKELVPGAVLYLPVAAPGGLFSAGDGHAMQGDGEVCLTAVETGLTGHFRIDLVKQANLEAPYAETPSHLIAMAFDQDLDEAVRVALRRMIDMIVARSTLTKDDAYRLCSLAADLRVTQVVNDRKGIHVMLSRALLEGAAVQVV